MKERETKKNDKKDQVKPNIKKLKKSGFIKEL
jgi:hypothetical protein